MSLSDLTNFVHPQPIYSVDVDGTDITNTLQGRLISLSLTDNRGFEADQIDISLDDTDGKLDLPARGATLRCWIGWKHSGLVYKGSYTIDEVSHSGTPDTLTIRGRSADLRTGLTTQRERSWHDVTLGDILETLADENDLTPAINATLAGQYIEHIDQTNESAVNLMTRLAKQFDAIATVKNGMLLFIPAAGGLSASGVVLPTVTITRESGDQHNFSIADRETYTGVKATYNDVQLAVKGEVTWGKDENSAENNEPVTAESTPTTGQYKALEKVHKSRDAALKAAKLEWKKMQKNKAAKAAYIGTKAKFNDRNLGQEGEVTYREGTDDGKAEAKDETPKVSQSADNIKTLRHVYANKSNALRAARAEWRKLQRGVATFTITLARGRPELFPELPATVSGWKPAIDSTDWIVSKVTHNLSDSGFTTGLELEIKATEVAEEE
ncbi:phage late control D family protein [Propionivibrio limicola]|uniref:phage late control D family protein n=1 Tax=Propionivibrio limicola TaxID=167645 RepID=UPI0012909FFC|nr:phage late control D family protein [Propionivibrio limicola]